MAHPRAHPPRPSVDGRHLCAPALRFRQLLFRGRWQLAEVKHARSDGAEACEEGGIFDL